MSDNPQPCYPSRGVFSVRPSRGGKRHPSMDNKAQVSRPSVLCIYANQIVVPIWMCEILDSSVTFFTIKEKRYSLTAFETFAKYTIDVVRKTSALTAILVISLQLIFNCRKFIFFCFKVTQHAAKWSYGSIFFKLN